MTTAVQVSNSSQTGPQVRSSPACLVNSPRVRRNSGKQDGREFNNRGGEVDHSTSVSEVANPHRWRARRQDRSRDVKTKLMDQAEGGQKQSKVEQTLVRVAQSQDDPAGQRRDEVGNLQEDRSKAVIAKAISEATKAVEKSSVRRFRVMPPKSAKAATARYPAECD